MNFEPQTLLLWGNLFLSLAAVAGHVKNWMSSGEKQLAKDVAALTVKIDGFKADIIEHDRRIQRLTAEFDHLPKPDALHKLEMSIERLNARLDVFAESLRPIRSDNDLVKDLLREQVKK